MQQTTLQSADRQQTSTRPASTNVREPLQGLSGNQSYKECIS
jgi:hypothetical protein